jgi:hypothetical protein
LLDGCGDFVEVHTLWPLLLREPALRPALDPIPPVGCWRRRVSGVPGAWRPGTPHQEASPPWLWLTRVGIGAAKRLEEGMRLHGRRAIMAYLGRSVASDDMWQRVKRRYAEAILRDGATGRVWAESAVLDAIRLRQVKPVGEAGRVDARGDLEEVPRSRPLGPLEKAWLHVPRAPRRSPTLAGRCVYMATTSGNYTSRRCSTVPRGRR